MKKITDEEIAFFDKNGYVILKGVLPKEELKNLQSESQRLIEEILAGGPADKWCNRGPEGVPYYLTYLHSQPNSASLRLLANPTILDLAVRMVGEDCVPTFESLVFKLPGNGSSVPWHRDAEFDRSTGHRIFNVDIYLDHSTTDNGVVWVVPESVHWSRERIREYLAMPTFEKPGMVAAEVEPGDILLHDIMVLHGSDINRKQSLRRVIYYEFRSARQILESGSWDKDWITARLKLLQSAIHERSVNPYPGEETQYPYHLPSDWATGYVSGDEVETMVKH